MQKCVIRSHIIVAVILYLRDIKLTHFTHDEENF